MTWNEEELVELATFLSRRMNTKLERRDPADLPPPGNPVGEWVSELKAANDAGRLPHLAKRVRAVDPDDSNLQEVCGLLGKKDHTHLRKMVAGSLVFGLALVVISGTTLWMAMNDPTPSVVLQPQSVTSVAAARTDTPATTESASVVAQAPSTVESSPEPELAMGPAQVTVNVVAEAPPPLPVPGCEAAAGELIGYWYAGEDAPGIAGEKVTIPQAVNVRADYPDVHNEFNKRADVRCILDEGALVVLTKAPIRVPGDHFWVPLVGGDLVPKTARSAVSRASTSQDPKASGA